MLTEEFDLVSVLGSGSYGEVYKAVHRQNGRVCAVKILSSESEESYQRIKNEISIMIECNNRNIVKCFGSEINEHGICLFLEYCAGGSIKDVLRSSPGTKLTEQHIASILQPTLLGLEYLHQRKTIHRDIKAGNILINEFGDIKLSDFGVSAELMHTLADKDTLIGSPFWMSPEVLSKNKYNCKTDIWSLGITAIELAEGEPPYSHIHPIRAMFAIQNNPPRQPSEPDKWSKEFNNFVKRCLHYDPSQRPSAKELLSDPFIVNKAKGQYILQHLVSNCSQILELHRKELKSSMSIKDKTSMINDGGTMIEHYDKIEEYEPFWEGKQEQEDTDGTMVVKDVHVEKKEADFVAFYREKQVLQERKIDKNDRQLGQRKSFGPSDRPKLKENRMSQLQSKHNEFSSISVSETQLKLDQVLSQMNIEIEQVKNKYKPQITYLTQLIQQSQIKHPKQPSKQKRQQEKSFRKLKSAIQNTQPNKMTQHQVRKTEPDSQNQKKIAPFVHDNFVSSTAMPPTQQPPAPRKTKLHQTQTFEQALNQLKESKKLHPEQDGSYFTSFLKKLKKNPGLKENTQNNHDDLTRTSKMQFNRATDKHQQIQPKSALRK